MPDVTLCDFFSLKKLQFAFLIFTLLVKILILLSRSLFTLRRCRVSLSTFVLRRFAAHEAFLDAENNF